MFRLGPPPTNTDVDNSMPMVWYFFLRYVFLWFGAARNIYFGVSMFMDGFVHILFGIVYMFFGVYCIVTRSALAKFRRSAPLHLTILFTSSLVTNVIFSFNLIIIIPGIVLIVANKVYFLKRDHLFIN